MGNVTGQAFASVNDRYRLGRQRCPPTPAAKVKGLA